MNRCIPKLQNLVWSWRLWLPMQVWLFCCSKLENIYNFGWQIVVAEEKTYVGVFNTWYQVMHFSNCRLQGVPLYLVEYLFSLCGRIYHHCNPRKYSKTTYNPVYNLGWTDPPTNIFFIEMSVAMTQGILEMRHNHYLFLTLSKVKKQ